MKKLRLAAAVVVAAAVTLLSPSAAQAYPDTPNVTLTLSDSVIYGGDTFDYLAEADVVCDWTITYNDGVAPGEDAAQTGSGSSLEGTYDTKVVSETFKSPITATCVYDDGVPAASAKIVIENEVTPAFYSADSGSAIQAASQDASASATVTLLPRDGDNDSDDNGILPDTGGSSMWFLVIGGALLVGGGGVLYAARRRQQPSH